MKVLKTYQRVPRQRQPDGAEKLVRDIRRATRWQFSAAEKICIGFEGLRGKDSIAEPIVQALELRLRCIARSIPHDRFGSMAADLG